jgi:hypothetical protein
LQNQASNQYLDLFLRHDNLIESKMKQIMKLNSQQTQYREMKSRKIIFFKKRENFAKPVNRPMDVLKLNNMFFFQNYFFNYMIKRKINDHIIELN